MINTKVLRWEQAQAGFLGTGVSRNERFQGGDGSWVESRERGEWGGREGPDQWEPDAMGKGEEESDLELPSSCWDRGGDQRSGQDGKCVISCGYCNKL